MSQLTQTTTDELVDIREVAVDKEDRKSVV